MLAMYCFLMLIMIDIMKLKTNTHTQVWALHRSHNIAQSTEEVRQAGMDQPECVICIGPSVWCLCVSGPEHRLVAVIKISLDKHRVTGLQYWQWQSMAERNTATLHHLPAELNLISVIINYANKLAIERRIVCVQRTPSIVLISAR